MCQCKELTPTQNRPVQQRPRALPCRSCPLPLHRRLAPPSFTQSPLKFPSSFQEVRLLFPSFAPSPFAILEFSSLSWLLLGCSILASHPLPPTLLLCSSSLPPSPATYQSKSRFIQHRGPRSSLSPKAFWLSSSRSSPGTPSLPLFSPSSMYLLPSSPLSHHCIFLSLAPQGSILMFHIKKACHISEIFKGSCNLTTFSFPHLPLLPSSLSSPSPSCPGTKSSASAAFGQTLRKLSLKCSRARRRKERR